MSVPPRSRNGDVARLLEEIGDLLEIKGESGFRLNAYRSAARRIESLKEPIEQVHAEGRLRKIQGVGPALEQKIGEYLTTGSLGYIEKLRAEFPAGLTSLLSVPGLGPRKARLVYDELGIGSLVELEAAARAGRLRDVAGLGARTEERLLVELDKMKQRSGRHQLGVTTAAGADLVADMLECAGVRHAAVVGSVRRMQDTIGNVDVLVATASPDEIDKYVRTSGRVRDVAELSAHRFDVVGRGDVKISLHVVRPDQWGAALLYHTGSVAHGKRLQALAEERGWKLTEHGLDTGPYPNTLRGATEDAVYEALGLQPISSWR
jgi:DNA polymerase (family 10)